MKKDSSIFSSSLSSIIKQKIFDSFAQDIEQVQTNVVKIAVSVCQNEILAVKKIAVQRNKSCGRDLHLVGSVIKQAQSIASSLQVLVSADFDNVHIRYITQAVIAQYTTKHLSRLLYPCTLC